MNIRDKINSDKRVGVAVVGVLVALAVGLAYHFHEPPPGLPAGDPDSAYYSDDDGQTYFKDSVYKFAPYDHNGKTAEVAFVYRTSKGTEFVGYLMRFTPAARKTLVDAYAKVQSGAESMDHLRQLVSSPAVVMDGAEIKYPGKQSQWVPRSTMPYPKITTPDGDTIASLIYP